VSRVEQRFALANHIPVIRPSGPPAAVQNRSRRYCLAKAFRGELVPQDPNDEPASVLLERTAPRIPALRPSARPTGVPWRSRRQGQSPTRRRAQGQARQKGLGIRLKLSGSALTGGFLLALPQKEPKGLAPTSGPALRSGCVHSIAAPRVGLQGPSLAL
jgi:hypothetical protein